MNILLNGRVVQTLAAILLILPVVTATNTSFAQRSGSSEALPVPLPGPSQRSALPIPIPSPEITRIDPRKHPEMFSSLPVPLPGPKKVRSGNIGRYRYGQYADGRVMGETAYGWAQFHSMNDYRRFLDTH